MRTRLREVEEEEEVGVSVVLVEVRGDSALIGTEKKQSSPNAGSIFEDIAMSLVNQEIILEDLVLSHTTFLKTNSSQAELQKRSTSAKGSQRSIIMKERRMKHFTDFYCYLCVCTHNLNMLCT